MYESELKTQAHDMSNEKLVSLMYNFELMEY